MCEHETKSCPRCHRAFECKVGSILLCRCSSVLLSEDEKKYIQQHYTDCLCADCLKAMKAAWHNALFKERLANISRLRFGSNK